MPDPITGTVIAGVTGLAGTAYSSNKAASAQKEAADKQAKGIDNASRISQEAVSKARSDALALFNPAFADISTSLNQARGDLLAGRTSAQDILNQSFMKSASTLQTSGQQAMNAILGVQGQPQQPAQLPLQAIQPQPPTEQDILNEINRPQQPVLQPGGIFEGMAPDEIKGSAPQINTDQNGIPLDKWQSPPFNPNGGGPGGFSGGLRLAADQPRAVFQPQQQTAPIDNPDVGLRGFNQFTQTQRNLRGGFDQFQFNPMQRLK